MTAFAAGGEERAGSEWWRAFQPVWLRRLRTLAGSVPPIGLILLGIASVQLGSALAKRMFDVLSPAAVVFLRLAIAAAVLAVAGLPSLRGATRGALAAVAGLGIALAGMNLAFYEALARLPLGVVVTVEFLGPLTLAVVGSRRLLDVVWVVLAGTGVVLLGGGVSGASAIGLIFAGVAAVGWAAYILLAAAVGRHFTGTSILIVAFGVGAVTALPAGVATGGADLLNPQILLAAAGVALLSSVIPYSLELEALRRIPPRLFGLLMSMEPAVAALFGFAILGEHLAGRQWTAIILVMAACAGATWSRREP